MNCAIIEKTFYLLLWLYNRTRKMRMTTAKTRIITDIPPAK
jgi:hypothetical protein